MKVQVKIFIFAISTLQARLGHIAITRGPPGRMKAKSTSGAYS